MFFNPKEKNVDIRPNMHYNKNVTHRRQTFWLLIKSFGNDADAIIPVRLAAPTTIGGIKYYETFDQKSVRDRPSNLRILRRSEPHGY